MDIPKGIGDLLRGVFESFFWGVVDVVDAFISAATGGILKNAWSRLIAGEDVGEIVIGGLVMSVTGLIDETSTTIVGVLADLENQVSAHFSNLLGLTGLQTSIAESLQHEIEAITGKWEAETEAVESAEEAAARELAESTMMVLSDRATFYQDQYSVWVGRFAEMEAEEEGLQFETSIAGLEMASHMLDIDVTMIHDLAEERNVAAVIGMTEEINQALTTADDWAKDTAIVPLAYGDIISQIMGHYLDATPDELKEQLRILTQASYEIAGELIPDMTPSSGGE